MGSRGSKSGSGIAQPTAQQPPTPQTQSLDEYLGPKGAAGDIQDALDSTNPHYDQSIQNRDGLYYKNCQRCVWAVELRRRGYDVEAKPRIMDGSDVAQKMDPNIPGSFVNGAKGGLDFTNHETGSIFWKPKASDVTSMIKNDFPDNSRGALVMTGPGRGHVCNGELKNGKLTIYDGQTHTKHSVTEMMKKGFTRFQAARMDNVALSDVIKDFVRPKGGSY